jgi:hypothetical protein
MTFDEKYPDAEVNTHVDIQGDEFVKIARADLCYRCHRATYWCSTSFLTHICSEACSVELWNEYWEATGRANG